MSSAAPRWSTPRDLRAATWGGHVAKLAAAMGTPLMPWQITVADTALEIDPATGYLRYPLVVVTVPRQSGKSTLLRPVIARECLATDDASCWLTAQRRNDARDHWVNMVRSIERSPLGELTTCRRANGSESLTWATGAELRPFAPSEDALHGKTSRWVGVDEAWAFDAAQGAALMQAIVPTQATQEGAQIWIVSTAGTARSAWLRNMVDQGREECRAGGPASFAYFEWSIPDDSDLTDPQVYAEHHPAVGHTITPAALERARQAMDPAEYARAYGNYWTTAAGFAIAPALWEACRTREPFAPGAARVFACEVSADRAGAVIVAA
ncbi:terminase large subunit, partial [Streptomyces sp. T-3]|nr:terminase large subunit [Streptomyces sp. T-3]